MTNATPIRSALLRLACAGGIVAALGGCAADRNIATASIEPDYHQRHAVALAEGTEKLDVFAGPGNRLDEEQRRLVRQFAEGWRQRGQGPIVAMVPAGNGREAQTATTLEAIRHMLVDARVPGGLRVGNYPAEPGLAAPIQLSYPALEARVHECGDWREDVRATSYSNTPYPNFGCATQKTLAAQIDDPRDLVRPRAETPADSVNRQNAINGLRTDSGKYYGAIGGTGVSTTGSTSGN